MRGSLHCATDGETVRRFGRDDRVFGLGEEEDFAQDATAFGGGGGDRATANAGSLRMTLVLGLANNPALNYVSDSKPVLALEDSGW